MTEAYYVAFQLAWAVVFAVNGFVVCAVGAAHMATAVVSIAYFYSDHTSKVAFIFQRRRPRQRSECASASINNNAFDPHIGRHLSPSSTRTRCVSSECTSMPD